MAAKSSKTTTKRSSKRPPAAPPAAETTTAVEAVTTTTTTRAPSHGEIAQRAFELFLARGRQHGRAQEDWLTAERELCERYSVN